MRKEPVNVPEKSLRELIRIFPTCDVKVIKNLTSFFCMGERYFEESYEVFVFKGASVLIHSTVPTAAQLWLFVRELTSPIAEAERIARGI